MRHNRLRTLAILLLASCTKQTPTNQNVEKVKIQLPVNDPSFKLTNDWVSLLVHPRVESLSVLRSNCIDASNLLTLEWTETDLDCNKLLLVPQNKHLQHSECLSPQLLQMKVSECRPKAIDHILSKTVLPEEYSKYRKHGDQSLIPKEESLPEIFLKLSNETNFPMEIPDLEEWIETSNELGAIAVGLKVENSKQTTEWGKILNFLQDKPGPRKLKLHPSFFVDAPNIAKNSPEPLRIPVLKDSSNSPLGTALCSYLQNWMRARMVIYSKNTPSDGPPLNLQCSLLTDKPDARWSIVAKLALPLLHASSRAFVIKTRSELDSLKPLSDLRTF